MSATGESQLAESKVAVVEATPRLALTQLADCLLSRLFPHHLGKVASFP